MVYHRGCGKRTLAAAEAEAAATATITVEDDRDVERPEPTTEDPVNPTTTTGESPEGGDLRLTTRDQQLAPACVRRMSICINVYAYMGTYVLVAERRRRTVHATERWQRAVHAAERRQRAVHAAERWQRAGTGSPSNPTASVRVEDNRDILTAGRWQWADHLAATGSPANREQRTVEPSSTCVLPVLNISMITALGNTTFSHYLVTIFFYIYIYLIII